MDTDVTVGDVITREYVGVSEGDTVRDAVSVLRAERAAGAVVLRGSDAVGIVTEYDVLGVVEEGLDPDSTTVGELMSSPVTSVDAGTPLVDAAGLMSGEGIRNLVVEDRTTGEPLGILGDRDIIAAVASLQRSRPTEGTASSPSPVSNPTNPSRDADRDGSGGAVVGQGVCEVCGSLSEALYDRNGQLVCTDCREI